MTTDQTIPDAAVQIVKDVLPPGEKSRAPLGVTALARAGWLHDPKRVAALEAVAEAARQFAQDNGIVSVALGDALDALDEIAGDGA